MQLPAVRAIAGLVGGAASTASPEEQSSADNEREEANEKRDVADYLRACLWQEADGRNSEDGKGNDRVRLDKSDGGIPPWIR